jgi:hypothetical protein
VASNLHSKQNFITFLLCVFDTPRSSGGLENKFGLFRLEYEFGQG